MPQQFKGVIGRHPGIDAVVARASARPRGAPNVMYIILDDVGYGQLSPFGGLCETPTSTAWPPMACATPTSTQLRSVPLRVPAC